MLRDPESELLLAGGRRKKKREDDRWDEPKQKIFVLGKEGTGISHIYEQKTLSSIPSAEVLGASPHPLPPRIPDFFFHTTPKGIGQAILTLSWIHEVCCPS